MDSRSADEHISKPESYPIVGTVQESGEIPRAEVRASSNSGPNQVKHPFSRGHSFLHVPLARSNSWTFDCRLSSTVVVELSQLSLSGFDRDCSCFQVIYNALEYRYHHDLPSLGSRHCPLNPG